MSHTKDALKRHNNRGFWLIMLAAAALIAWGTISDRQIDQAPEEITES